MQNKSFCSPEHKMSTTPGLWANTAAGGGILYHDKWCCCCCWDRIQPAGPAPPNVSSCASLPGCPRWTEPSVAPGASFSVSVPAVLSGEKTEKSICYFPPNSSNLPWNTMVSFTPSPALQRRQLAGGRLGRWVTGNLSKKPPQPAHCWNTFCRKQQIIKIHLSEQPTSCQSLLGNNPWENNSVRILAVKQWEGKKGHEAEMPISVSVN